MWKRAAPVERQLERGYGKLRRERPVDRLGALVVHLADEPERDVQVFRRDPPRRDVDTCCLHPLAHAFRNRGCRSPDVVAQLVDLRRRAADYASRDGYVAEDEYFFAEQNARLVRNAEQYYRSMCGSRSESWKTSRSRSDIPP